MVEFCGGKLAAGAARSLFEWGPCGLGVVWHGTPRVFGLYFIGYFFLYYFLPPTLYSKFSAPRLTLHTLPTPPRCAVQKRASMTCPKAGCDSTLTKKTLKEDKLLQRKIERAMKARAYLHTRH